MTIPILETDRLILRPHNISDFEASAAMWSDPEVVKYISGKPSTRQQSWSRLMIYIGHWSLMNFGYWVVEEKSSGQFIGELGFADFKREINPSIEGIPELGWALTSSAHGKGYATEALKAVIDWGDSNLKIKKSACIINPQNLASIKVALKCGYKEFIQTIYANEPVILYYRN